MNWEFISFRNTLVPLVPCFTLNSIVHSFSICFLDHWWQKLGPNLAFLEAVRITIDNSSLFYSVVFPKIFCSLHLKSPRHLGSFLRKIKNQSWKATQTNNSFALLPEVSEIMADRQKANQPLLRIDMTNSRVAWEQHRGSWCNCNKWDGCWTAQI